MRKFIVGILLGGILLSGGWFAYGAIQQEVGINLYDKTLGVWKRVRAAPATSPQTQVTSEDLLATVIYTQDRTQNGYKPLAAHPLSTGTLSNTTGVNGLDVLAFPYFLDGTTWTAMPGITGTNVPMTDFSVSAPFSGWSIGLVCDKSQGLGSVLKCLPQSGTDVTSLSETLSSGGTLTAPLSTWSVTHTPAVATQATASKTAGASLVRHVATSVTVCLAAGATAQTPILIHLRDGATGAGTVLRTWVISAPINSSECTSLSGIAMMGSSATAMTLEFATAGVADSQETVTLTGFSVN